MKLNNLKHNLVNMSKTAKNTFFESVKGSTGKIDHKRLTVFAFVIMFFITTIVVLYKKTEIPNAVVIDTILVTMASVILGGMGFTKIPTKKQISQENETE